MSEGPLKAFLGIDIGTSSLKALILDTQGRTLGQGSAEYAITTPQPGWAEIAPDDWWQATISALRVARNQAPHAVISAIGLSGQMHGVVLVGDEGRPLRPAILWPDSRAEEALERYRALPEGALQRLSNPLVPGMAGPILCWLAQHEPAMYGTARWALQPKDWLRLRLTGASGTDPSDASATLLYDLPGDTLADDVIAALGLNRRLLPPLLPSSALAGTLSPAAAAALDLPPGLPVATGAADTAAAAVGTGLLNPEPIQLTLGTGAQMIRLLTTPTSDPTGRTHLYRAADERHWYVMAAVQNAGLALDWARRIFGATWDELYASASADPADTPADADLDPIFLPYLTRERSRPSSADAGGAFIGLRMGHERRRVLRATLEGVAFGLRAAYETLPGAKESDTIRLAGGGSVQPAWRQMLADILGLPLLTVDVPAASARGAALLAGISIGDWATAAATEAVAPTLRSAVTPDLARHDAYEKAYARYKESAARL